MSAPRFIVVIGTALVLLVAAKAQAWPSPENAQSSSAPESLVTKTYAVTDLVIPVNDHVSPNVGAPVPVAPFKVSGDKLDQRLMTLIRNHVAPQSWSTKGGAGKIEFYPLGMGLVVTQTKKNHEEIRELLSALRRLQDVEVALDVQFLWLSKACCAKLEALAGRKGGAADTKTDSGRFVNLDDVQGKRLLELVQQDRSIQFLQAPKITVFNGQRADFQLMESRSFLTAVKAHFNDATGALAIEPKNEHVELGIKFEACPVVAADRRSVLLHFRCQMAALAAEPIPVLQRPEVLKQTVDQEFRIADGRSVLIYAGRQPHGLPVGVAPPALSMIPYYVGQLFGNSGHDGETECTVIVVTPRIIINAEEEIEEISVLPVRTTKNATEDK